jgi:hypothetical protein
VGFFGEVEESLGISGRLHLFQVLHNLLEERERRQ